MNNVQAAEFIYSQIQPRWPKWRPTEIEIRDWMGWLERYDYDVAGRAAIEHARTSRFFSRPVTGEFFAICDALHRQRRQDRQDRPKRDAEPRQKAYLVCTEHSPKNSWVRKGVTFVVVQESKDDDLRQRAEQHRGYYENLYAVPFKIQFPP
jgi:hypothetical protein